MSSSKCVPIVDFSAYTSDMNGSKESRRKTSEEVYQVLRRCGFLCLVNHGISLETIEEVNVHAKRFFEQPDEVKLKHKRGDSQVHGYEPLESFQPNPDRPGDLAESYQFVHPEAADKNRPCADDPEFERSVQNLQEECKDLARNVLQALAEALNLQDPRVFEESHHIGDPRISNRTGLRVINYPSVSQDMNMKPGQIRCGEHTDWGSIALIFQDEVGGLEVQNFKGEWMPVTPIPNTVLVNTGDSMQRWTADRLLATKHRVVLPETQLKRQQPRRSLVYFVQPDNDCIIQCLDGSTKYKPILCSDYLKSRDYATFSLS